MTCGLHSLVEIAYSVRSSDVCESIRRDMEESVRESIEYALGIMSSADKMVLSRLNEKGMAWIVGGWVRDSL